MDERNSIGKLISGKSFIYFLFKLGMRANSKILIYLPEILITTTKGFRSTTYRLQSFH